MLLRYSDLYNKYVNCNSGHGPLFIPFKIVTYYGMANKACQVTSNLRRTVIYNDYFQNLHENKTTKAPTEINLVNMR